MVVPFGGFGLGVLVDFFLGRFGHAEEGGFIYMAGMRMMRRGYV